MNYNYAQANRLGAKDYRRHNTAATVQAANRAAAKAGRLAALRTLGGGPAGVRPGGNIARYAAQIPARRDRMAEHKTFDYNPTGAAVVVQADNAVAPAATPFAPVAGATGGCINQVPLGNSSITRVGRKLSINAVAIRGRVLASSATKVSKATMLLVWDRNVNQSVALPAWNAILNAQSSISLTNKDNAPRFKILRRWDYVITGNSNTAGQQNDESIHVIEEFVKLKNKVTIFTTADSTGLYPDMMEGGLLLYMTSDQTGATVAPTFEVNTRVYFEDH